MKLWITSIAGPSQPNARHVSSEILRDRGDTIRFLDREFGDRIKRGVLADDGDVGAVKGSYQGYVSIRLAQHFPRNPGAGSVRDRVVAMKELEAVGHHHLVHAHRKREVVGREFKQRIPANVDFVKEDPRQERRKSERLAVSDEMDFVAALGQRHAQLGCYRAGSAVGRITSDANLHSALSHHSRAIAPARESSGFNFVTASAGN